MIVLKSNEEIEIMRRAGAVAAEVLLKLEENIKPGVSTLDLDRIAEEFIRSRGATPTFIGYQGYPKTLCTSINEEVVHGIPSSKRILQAGDVIGVDCGVTLQGFVGDHAKTFSVGEVSAEKAKLLQVTEEALFSGIAQIHMGQRIGDISAAVESVARRHGYGVVKDFVGHGIGRKMHEEPQVPNFGVAGTGPRMKAGLVLAIEPMFNLGTGEVKVLGDGWTVVTQDKRCSAHFEHTIALTPTGSVILTQM